MKNIIKTGLGVVAAATITATSAISAFAWGPDRPTYTLADPAGHITFNSITDNNVEVGDERYFVSASHYSGNGANNKWTDNTIVEDGKEYVVRMYVHNNAASNLKLVAENVRAVVVLPTTAGSSVTVDGKIYSTNANPSVVWDQTTFKSANGEHFFLSYVEGTAEYYNTKNGVGRTFSLDTPNYDLFTSTGVKLGYDQMDGKIPGCNEYSGYVTFHVKANFEESLELNKEVRLDGTKEWSEYIKVKSGDVVNYRIGVKNISNEKILNLVVRDLLPNGLTYINGTTKVYNTTSPNGVVIDDDIITEKGINIGDYNPGGNAWIYFSAKVNDVEKLECGDTTLRNVVEANGGTGLYRDTADVGVSRECKETPPPVKECKPGIPAGDPRCYELPTTGPSSVTGAILGAGSLVVAASYYVISRKKAA